MHKLSAFHFDANGFADNFAVKKNTIMETENNVLLDDKQEKHPPYSSKCWFCKHFSNFECAAFPNGIDDKYLSGKQIHTQVDENQVGDYVFTELT